VYSYSFQIKKGESITLNRIHNDLEIYVAQKQNDMYDSLIGLSDTCPPHGFHRTRMVIVMYYADMVDNDAMDKIISVPTHTGWNNTKTFLAAQNTTTGSSSFMDQVPITISYWAGLLTERLPRPHPDLPPSSRHTLYRWNNVIMSWNVIIYIFL
jgi:hypothetical protein